MFEVGAVTIAFVIVVCVFILLLIALLCAVSFYIGCSFTLHNEKTSDRRKTANSKPLTTAYGGASLQGEALSEEEKRKLAKEKKELENFYSYTGEAQ